MKVLVVDDEYQLADAIVEILKKEGFECDAVYDGLEAVKQITKNNFDAVVLDVMLPKMNGFEVLKKIREIGENVPVLMLSAKGEISDKVQGLDLGADDYLAKPFDSFELIARIKAISRRKGEVETDNVIKVSNVVLDKSTYSISCNENSVVLGVKEFKIMELLLSNFGKILPKDEIISKIWGKDYETEYNNIEVYASFLRRKLTTIGAKIQIKSHRGVGYKTEEIND